MKRTTGTNPAEAPVPATERSRLARECARLDRSEEQALADERYAAETEGPEY